jgi:hypothetical protein
LKPGLAGESSPVRRQRKQNVPDYASSERHASQAEQPRRKRPRRNGMASPGGSLGHSASTLAGGRPRCHNSYPTAHRWLEPTTNPKRSQQSKAFGVRPLATRQADRVNADGQSEAVR